MRNSATYLVGTWCLAGPRNTEVADTDESSSLPVTHGNPAPNSPKPALTTFHSPALLQEERGGGGHSVSSPTHLESLTAPSHARQLRPVQTNPIIPSTILPIPKTLARTPSSSFSSTSLLSCRLRLGPISRLGLPRGRTRHALPHAAALPEEQAQPSRLGQPARIKSAAIFHSYSKHMHSHRCAPPV